jgi:hypothetical protein
LDYIKASCVLFLSFPLPLPSSRPLPSPTPLVVITLQVSISPSSHPLHPPIRVAAIPNASPSLVAFQHPLFSQFFSNSLTSALFRSFRSLQPFSISHVCPYRDCPRCGNPRRRRCSRNQARGQFQRSGLPRLISSRPQPFADFLRWFLSDCRHLLLPSRSPLSLLLSPPSRPPLLRRERY